MVSNCAENAYPPCFHEGHIMIDIETLSLSEDAIILQIAAVEFNAQTGKTQGEFNCLLDATSQAADYGRVADDDTIAWWQSQDPETRAMAMSGKVPLPEALRSLFVWVEQTAYRYDAIDGLNGLCVWSSSLTLDGAAIDHACRQTGVEKPWPFYALRCTRTIEWLSGRSRSDIPRPRHSHDALSDCKYQVQYLCAALDSIRAQRCTGTEEEWGYTWAR